MAALRHRPAGQAGVTLAEMLATVAVLAVAASVAVPSADPASGFAAEAVAAEVARAMRFAQREAIRTNAFHTVAFDTTAQSLQVYRTPAGGASGDTSIPALHPLDKRPYQFRFGGGPARAVLASVDFKYDDNTTPKYIAFGPDGEPAYVHGSQGLEIDPLKNDGKVTITHGRVSRDVVIDAHTGRVTF